MGFKFRRLEIPEVVLIEPEVFEDHRGKSIKLYEDREFAEYGISTRFMEDYQSESAKNVIRGLHFQTEPYADGKLIRVLSGRIFDVAIDVRKGSSTYGKYVTVRLSSDDRSLLWIPPGFAHGYLCLEDNTVVFYKISAEYRPEYAKGMVWNDVELNIPWPIEGEPLISKKDSELPSFREFRESQ